MPTPNKYDLLHARNVRKYEAQVRALYIKAIKEISKTASKLNLNASNELFLRSNSSANKTINAVLQSLNSRVYVTTVEGINSEWDVAVEKNNAVAEKIYGKGLKDLPQQYREKYLSNNAQARQNFVERKLNGLGLSDRVWKNTDQFKKELELALEYGIGKGQSAQKIARDIGTYLNDPDKLFRRVRNGEGGELRLSKAAKAYNPGQGRYRSSYKNALRLTRNETNFSYEGSNHLKRQQQDFIVGVEIRTSPQHNPKDDKNGISCIDLQGKYPKDFDFTYKWHVNCKCMSLNILKTPDELDKDLDLILSGKEPLQTSENLVQGLPKNYTGYLKDNADKWKNWQNQPRTFVNNKGLKFEEPEMNLKEFSKGFVDYRDITTDDVVSLYEKESALFRPIINKNDDIKVAVSKYKFGNIGSGKVFEMVRTRLSGGDLSKYSSTDLLRLDDYINSLSKLAKENLLQKDLKVYRMVNGDNFGKELAKLKKGELFTDKSFVSVALQPMNGFGKYEIEIYMSKGSQAVNILNPGELEYLIQKNSTFKVLEDVTENKIILQLL